ncbi:MAG: hypothetical protein IPN34_17470 [Planctomycetes bacterium]|nr:hypothetical protein [Planctomycetota bacterium]
MRQDMAKVLVDRARRGVKSAKFDRRRNRRAAKHDVNVSLKHAESSDAGSIAESMGRGRLYGFNCKELNDYLSPLKRFIEANVGRPWDKVYSEIRARVRFENTVQQHIMQRIWGYVERNVVLDDQAMPCESRSSRPLRRNEFFIHPISGLLLRGKAPGGRRWWPKKEGSKPKGWRALPGGERHQYEECRILDREVYVKANGIWYEADMRPLPSGLDWGGPRNAIGTKPCRERTSHSALTEDVEATDLTTWDCILRREIGWRHDSSDGKSDPSCAIRKLIMDFYGRVDRYCAGKGRQLDTKALRRLGLTNC